MPHILPPPEHPDVTWPANEGAIGVVGVAPWATLDFCRKIYELTPAAKDWHFPRLIVDANSKIPSRGRHLELGERDPSPFINATIHELAKAGATVAVVPCNTAHMLFDRWSRPSPIKVLSIVDATIGLLNEARQTVAVLSSRYVAGSGLYQRALRTAGHRTFELTAEYQDLVSDCIARLKRTPALTVEQAQALARFTDHLRANGIAHVVLACTELSLISAHPLWGDVKVIDSNTALAMEAMQAISLQWNSASTA